MGGDFFPSEENPAVGGPGTDMVGPMERLEHVEALLPEICSLDCGTLNFGEGCYVSTPEMLRAMAQKIKDLGVKPELECFDMGHVRFATQLVKEGWWKIRRSTRSASGFPGARRRPPRP